MPRTWCKHERLACLLRWCIAEAPAIAEGRHPVTIGAGGKLHIGPRFGVIRDVERDGGYRSRHGAVHDLDHPHRVRWWLHLHRVAAYGHIAGRIEDIGELIAFPSTQLEISKRQLM